jgi:heme-degrading monooxygenase HmoA
MEAHREPVAPGRDERVCYVSTLRVRIKSGTANEVERLFTAHSVPAWRELQARGELLAVTLVRPEAADDQYDLITRWASKEAHDRNEDSFVAEAYALAVACYLAARPTHLI